MTTFYFEIDFFFLFFWLPFFQFIRLAKGELGKLLDPLVLGVGEIGRGTTCEELELDLESSLLVGLIGLSVLASAFFFSGF